MTGKKILRCPYCGIPIPKGEAPLVWLKQHRDEVHPNSRWLPNTIRIAGDLECTVHVK